MESASGDRRVLVIGYGNTLRGDDGLGPRVAALLEADKRLLGARIVARHQLVPELAAEFAEADLVILVDASESVAPGEVAVRRLDEEIGTGERLGGAAGPAPSSTWTHHVDAASLLALARELLSATPEAYVVAIGAESMELGDGLSAAAERALPAAVDAVAAIVVSRG